MRVALLKIPHVGSVTRNKEYSMSVGSLDFVHFNRLRGYYTLTYILHVGSFSRNTPRG
jgi:hypothetical protein